MPTVINFYTWEKNRVKEMIETNEIIDCPDCHLYEWGCDECGDSGLIECGSYCGELNAYYKEYFTIVVKDLKDWCSYTHEDFFIHIGQFIKESNHGIRSIR